MPVSERSVKKSSSFLSVFLNYVAFDSCPDVLPRGMFMLHLHGRTRTKRKSPLAKELPERSVASSTPRPVPEAGTRRRHSQCVAHSVVLLVQRDLTFRWLDLFYKCKTR